MHQMKVVYPTINMSEPVSVPAKKYIPGITFAKPTLCNSLLSLVNNGGKKWETNLW